MPPYGYKPMIKSWAQLVEESGRDPAQELQKAMATTNLGTGFGDATPLRLEDLDRTMTSVLYKQPSFVLYNWINKTHAEQIDWQWNRRNSYGSARQAPGFREGQGPGGRNSSFTRNTATVKFMGMAGGYTLQDSRVGQAGGQVLTPEQIENEDTTIELLKLIEQWIFWGDSAIKDNSGNTVNYDGILKQVTTGKAANVIDKKGQPLTVDDLEAASEDLRSNAFVTDFADMVAFMTPSVLSSFSNTLVGKERRIFGESWDGKLGQPVAGYTSNFGYIPFKDSIWLQRSDAPLAAAVGDAPPAAPGSLTVGTPGSDANSFFTETGDNAVYYYWAAAVGDGGESAYVAGSGAATIALNQSVLLTVARVSTNTAFYKIYRSTTNDVTTARQIGYVVQPASSNATFTDVNAYRTNTGIVALLNKNPENLIIPQLMPLMKLNQPLNKTTQPFYLLLYHTLVVRASERQKIWVNVGRAGI